ncbi:MAG: YibE/F family protein [Actinobacteria bacterium]|nr:YibE/F family protein [Actinomycetota bacterium]
MGKKINFKNLVYFLIIIFQISIFLILPGCSSEKKTFEQWDKIEAERMAAIEEDVQYKGKVLEIVSDTEEELEGGLATRTQVLKVKITNGPFKGEIIEVKNSSDARSAYVLTIKEGQGIFLKPEFDEEGNISGAYLTELVRDSYLIIIIILFIIVLVLVGRFKGFKAAIALALTVAAVFFILIPLILKGLNPILISVLIGVAVTCITLLIISGINKKSFAAIIGTSSGILISGTLALIFGSLASLTGFSSEESVMLMYIPQDIDFNYKGLLFAGIILASLGAVMDTGMSVSSSMFEVAKADPTIKKEDLISAGMNIGRDVIGTMSNTLILVYVGSSLPLILLFMAYKIPFMDIINKDMIATEIIQAVSGSIGLILTIPITVFVCAVFYNTGYIRSARHMKK